MASSSLLATVILLSSAFLSLVFATEDAQMYIVAVRRQPEILAAGSRALKDYYSSFLSPRTDAAGAADDRIVYAYEEALSGFAARLTPAELAHVSAKEGFLRAHRDRTIPLKTTRSPFFLRLREGQGLWRGAGGNYGEGVVIGVIDSGFSPGHPSFADVGMRPRDGKWAALDCPEGSCNNKVVRYASFLGPRSTTGDAHGHGTHTASTAAGNFVDGASVEGQGGGRASGVAPRAYLAVYQACDLNGCDEAGITAAFDQAIKDGVHVLSISIGAATDTYYGDSLAISALAAVEKGIVVSMAAGNYLSDLANAAPWQLTVAASSIDRAFRATVTLPDGESIEGETILQPENFPADPVASIAVEDCLDDDLSAAKGKIVVCGTDLYVMLNRTLDAGAVAVIIVGNDYNGVTIPDTVDTPLPTVRVTWNSGQAITYYLNHTKDPALSLAFHGTKLGNDIPAPIVASFNSRGPSKKNPLVLKPDIIAPGANIIAAWPQSPRLQQPQQQSGEYYFNVMSGTSMATPHVAGVAALLKAAHPEWSPAAIKSAIVTTSDVTDNAGKPILNSSLVPASFLEMGAGHVNPERASDPGLVFDIDPEAYISFLCGLDYTNDQVSVIARRDVVCADTGPISQADLNYPSISAVVLSGETVWVNRTVTNVGPAAAITFKAQVDAMRGVTVSVAPDTLEFRAVGESKTFAVKLSSTGRDERERSEIVEGNLRWVSGNYVVRVPIHVFGNLDPRT